ncbi:MAG: uroporphyrinogen-III synthase [Hyphomicrobiales bacterium]|nr:uroporphyrinogen-III synthase [Hyphomicrobiales bacterium]
MRILVTRPPEDAERQAEQLRALGHTPLIYPLLEIVFPKLTPLELSGVQGVIVTSRNGLRGLQANQSFERAKALPLYCVGEGTAELAAALGFTRVISGQGRARDLVPVICHAARPGDGALLYLTGQHLAFDLETPLIDAGFFVPRVICYEARELLPHHAERLAEILRQREINGIILMSPRTASIFARIIKCFKVEEEARAITCYCYSEAIAKSLEEIDGLTIAISSHPKETELTKLIGAASIQETALAELERALGKR